MCSIFLSTSKEEFLKLVDLNQTRGKFSYSYGVFSNNYYEIIKKDFGLFDKSILTDDADIHIGHCQAPTGGLEKNLDRIHPSKIDSQYLYHNGLLKPEFLKFSTIDYHGWDTFYLNYLLLAGFSILEIVEGSFACVFVKNNSLYFFRNSLCPLFINSENGFSLSSVKLNNHYNSINPCEIYKYEKGEITTIQKFKDSNAVYNI